MKNTCRDRMNELRSLFAMAEAHHRAPPTPEQVAKLWKRSPASAEGFFQALERERSAT